MADKDTATGSAADERCIDHVIRGKCSSRDVDLVLSELAGQQHGVVARWQLLAAGVGRRAIDERLGRRLHSIHRGVYAVGYLPQRAESRWMAAVLMAGPEAVVSHRTAAQLWQLMSRSGYLLELTRPSHLRAHPQIRGHRSLLPEDERTVVDGIPVTTVPRTVFDLAALVPPRQVERVLNEVQVQGLTDRLSIPDLLARYPRRRGSAVLRALLDDDAALRGVTKSELEERFVSLLDSYGLKRPRFNADVAAGGRFFSADCLWPDDRLIVELDGRAVHGTHRAFEADRERDRLLMVDGWRVMRVTWRQLRDHEAAIAADLRKALRQ